MATSHESGSHHQERKASLDEAVKVGEDFVRLYYKTLEQRPHRVHQLYLAASVVIWDGNPVVGTQALQQLFEDLPSMTFNVASMDAQPVSNVAVTNQKSYMINVSGTLRVPGGGGNRGFFQTFVVTAEGGKWKVASDVLRSQISPNQADI